MRGSPIIRTGLVLFALLLLILPLRSLTSMRAVAPLIAKQKVIAPEIVRLTVTSTSVPFRFQISHLGQLIWEGESSTNSSSKSLTMPFPAEGIDLLVQASWSEKKETAIRIEAARGESAPISRTLWGTEQVDDVVTFAPSS